MAKNNKQAAKHAAAAADPKYKTEFAEEVAADQAQADKKTSRVKRKNKKD